MAEKILVIDDEPEIRAYLTDLFSEGERYQVLTAENGELGLRLIVDEQPDLVILDERMPVKSGLQVLQDLVDRQIQVPVILSTVHGSEQIAIRALRLGIKDYVVKPFEPHEMRDAAERVLTDARVRRERDELLAKLAQANERLEAKVHEIEIERGKLEAVLSETGEAIVVLDTEERVLMCNPVALNSLSMPEDSVGRVAREAIAHPALQELFHSVPRAGYTLRTEVPLEDGRTFNALLSPVNEVGYVLMMQDITHLKELDRIKSEFVFTVSHDLRTPLTTIQGYVGLLERVGALNNEQQEFVKRIRVSIADITDLISELLDLGRIEAGYDLEMEPLHLESIIDLVVEEFQHQITQKQLELRWEKTQLPLLRGNARRLRQAIENLLGNAVKYTPEGGWVSIEAGEDDGHVVVRVVDNGIGIPLADQPYIFERFYRVESSQTQTIKGTGLGLTIVKSVIEKHGGRIWVESRPDVGSVFTFVLPTME